MNGGRKKWLEEDRPLSKDNPANLPKGNFKASLPDENIRVFLDEVKKALDQKHRIRMVDVRSPKEFTGEILAPPEYPRSTHKGEAISRVQRICLGLKP
jgi:thiosulfate/3-mercaptopyruvate sulfurtransferase